MKPLLLNCSTPLIEKSALFLLIISIDFEIKSGFIKSSVSIKTKYSPVILLSAKLRSLPKWPMCEIV